MHLTQYLVPSHKIVSGKKKKQGHMYKELSTTTTNTNEYLK